MAVQRPARARQKRASFPDKEEVNRSSPSKLLWLTGNTSHIAKVCPAIWRAIQRLLMLIAAICSLIFSSYFVILPCGAGWISAPVGPIQPMP